MKTGLILFTYNHPNVKKPLSLVSSIIRIFTTGKLKRKDHTPTHTAQTIMIDGELFVIDSDTFGIIPRKFEDWKKGRAWVHVFDPCILNAESKEKAYIKKALDKSGTTYDFKSIVPQLRYQVTGKYKGVTDPEVADNNFICSEFTAWLYGYKLWHLRSPANLFKNRFFDAPFGVDIVAGIPDDIKL